MFNQHENNQGAILKKRARVEEINLILNRPVPPGASRGGRIRLIEEKLHLENAIAELEVEDSRLLARKKAQRDVFRWENLDQRLVSPKTSELADEMHKRIADAERRISFECSQRNNMCGYLARLSDFHEKLTDEWAGRLYEAYCAAWRQQRQEVSPSFIRAVRDRSVRQLITARTSSVAEGFMSWNRRTGGLNFNPHVSSNWEMKMMRLWDRWNRKLEGEAAAAEYAVTQISQIPPSTVQVDTPLSQPGLIEITSVWHGFHKGFMALNREEQTAAPGNAGDRWLRTHVMYENPEAKFGEYSLSRGIGESFVTRFEALATRAGFALKGPQPDTKPINIWLHHLFQDLRAHQSKLLLAPTEKGGIIAQLCEASAIYCLRLEIEDWESKSPEKEEKKDTLPVPLTLAVLSGNFPLSTYRSEVKRAILMQIVHNPRATDHEICRGLDADGAAELPTNWKTPQNDRSFTAAYLNPSVRNRLEIAISKVRADLRKNGLLAPR